MSDLDHKQMPVWILGRWFTLDAANSYKDIWIYIPRAVLAEVDQRHPHRDNYAIRIEKSRIAEWCRDTLRRIDQVEQWRRSSARERRRWRPLGVVSATRAVASGGSSGRIPQDSTTRVGTLPNQAAWPSTSSPKPGAREPRGVSLQRPCRHQL